MSRGVNVFRIRRRIFPGLLVAILGACSPGPPRPVAPPKPAASPAAKPAASPAAAQGGGQVRLGDFVYTDYGTRDVRGKATQDLDVGDFYFRGTFLRGNAGDKLRLRVRNVSGQAHNFSLPAQQLDRDIPPGGERAEVLVTLPDSGGLRFFCKYHTSQGMNGQLLTGGAQPQPLASAAGRELD